MSESVIKSKSKELARVFVERTNSAALVQSVISHPEIKPYTWDDVGEPPVYFHETIYYLVPKEEHHADGAVEDVTLGIVAFIPVNPATWNPHMAILPEHRGKGTEALRAAMRWMFENTACRKLVAHPPIFNARMIRVFEKCAFKREGLSPLSFPWHGELHDRVLMGIEKETV